MPIFRPSVETTLKITQHPIFGDWLWSRIGFVGSGYLILFAVGYFLYDQHLHKISTRAVGTVVVLDKNIDDQSIAIVEFMAEGKAYRIQGIPSTPATFTMGEKVNLYYDSAAPQNARIDVWFERYFFVFVSVVMAVVFALWGRYFNKRYKNPSKAPTL